MIKARHQCGRIQPHRWPNQSTPATLIRPPHHRLKPPRPPAPESEAAARQKLLDIRQQVEAGGDFAKFASTYSQDGSASQGGDLGWISPGETVPEFERAMNNLKDGEISEPVRSEYGYHLIQVLGRREAQGSVQQQMDLARQAIGQRKAEQAYSDWLRQLRDSAYVQYKVGGPLAQQQ